MTDDKTFAAEVVQCAMRIHSRTILVQGNDPAALQRTHRAILAELKPEELKNHNNLTIRLTNGSIIRFVIGIEGMQWHHIFMISGVTGWRSRIDSLDQLKQCRRCKKPKLEVNSEGFCEVCVREVPPGLNPKEWPLHRKLRFRSPWPETYFEWNHWTIGWSTQQMWNPEGRRYIIHLLPLRLKWVRCLGRKQDV